MVQGTILLRRSIVMTAPYAVAALIVFASSAPTVDQLTEYSALRAYISSAAPSEIFEPLREAVGETPAPAKDSFRQRRSLLAVDPAAAGNDPEVSDTPRLVLASYGDIGAFLPKARVTAPPEPEPEPARKAPKINRLNKQDRTVSSTGMLTQKRVDRRTGKIIKVTRLINLPAAAPPVTDQPAQTLAAKSKENDETVNHASAEKAKRELQCLAKAVYFEARGESEDGQLAVAQVVMNRVKHWYYPDDVCGVVFQNEQRRNKCQFSFACDGKTDQPLNKQAWERAVTMAKKVLHGQARSKEIGDSTHYHANYVRPKWVRDMIKVRAIGTHIFYKVRGWS